MARSYAELQGSIGRSVFHRPERHRARELFSPEAHVQVSDGVGRYPVLDLSSSGLCVLAPDEVERWPVGRRLVLQLLMHGRSTQELHARVARVERRGQGMRVGIGLTQSFLDLDGARSFDRNQHLARHLDMGPEGQLAQVPAELRAAVSDMVYYVQHYRRCLQPHEADARRQGDAALQALAAQAYASMAPRFVRLREAASRAMAPHMDDAATVAAAKEYTETVLTPLLLSAPMVKRAYEKPLGYPGDYRVMLYYYDDAFEGATAFAKVIHRLFVQHPLSAGVPTRKDYVVGHLDRHFDAHAARAGGRTYRVTSLGCGPALEVSDFISRRGDWRGEIDFRLIDQESRTLEVAHDGAHRALSTASGEASVQCLNLAFSQLLAEPALLLDGQQADFVYCTGLFDYLRPALGAKLIATLYAGLGPGGELLVGNAAAPNMHFFCPEFVLDWSLIYRTRAEMVQLAAALPEEAEVQVEPEPGGAYFFIRVRRPAATRPT